MASAPVTIPAPALPTLRVLVDLTSPIFRGLQCTVEVPEDASHDIVEEWGLQSFPASDPPANW